MKGSAGKDLLFQKVLGVKTPMTADLLVSGRNKHQQQVSSDGCWIMRSCVEERGAREESEKGTTER